MKLTHILAAGAAGAAGALMVGAAQAQAQVHSPAHAPPAELAPGVADATARGDVPPGVDVAPDADTSVNPPAPAATDTDVTAPVAASTTAYDQGATVTTTTVTNGPVPDTAENRAKYGQPLSQTGRRTATRGN